MKIRCEQNSIRLRLRKSELVQLRAEQWLESGIHFPDGTVLTWEIALEDDLAEISATFDQGRIAIKIPGPVAQQWMDSETVSVERFMPLGDDTALHVLIEKDFPCKDRPEQDTSDFFTELAEDLPLKC